MELDIRTLIIVIITTYLIQALVFYYQYKINKNITGPGWWLLWSLSGSVMLGLMFVRHIPSFQQSVIVLQNAVAVSGMIFLYIGTLKFFGRNVHLKFLISVFIIFLAVHLYFNIVNDDIKVRTILISLTFSLFSFLTAFSILKFKDKGLVLSSSFNAIIFILYGSFFVNRAIMIYLGIQSNELLSPSLLNSMAYFIGLVISFVLTLGFIMMINQRLTSEINEAKAHFELIFHTSPDAIIISRLNDRQFLECNESFANIFGFSNEEILDNSPNKINYWKNPDDRKEVIRIIGERGSCYNYETFFSRKNGQTFPGLLSAKILVVKETPYLYSVIRDITERKEIEEKLRKSENELKQAQQITHIGNFSIDLTTNEVTWTEELYKIYGLDPSLPPPLLNESQTLFTHESWELLSSSIAETVQTGEPYEIELATSKKESNKGWMWARGEAIKNSEGKVTNIWGAIQDITERKLGEEALKRSEAELLELNATKDKFFSIIAHDLKGPISTILGFSGLLVENERSLSNEEKELYLKNIYTTSENTYELLGELLDWSRSQSGNIRFEPQNMHLQNLVNDVFTMFEQASNNKKINLLNSVGSEISVFSDKNMLNTIIRNLVSNAIKYSNENGTITFSAELKDSFVEVSIADNGIGMNEKTLQSLFKLSETISKPGTANEKGTGLGLILCKDFVGRHNGRIWVDSEVGKGTVFYFTIPSS